MSVQTYIAVLFVQDIIVSALVTLGELAGIIAAVYYAVQWNDIVDEGIDAINILNVSEDYEIIRNGLGAAAVSNPNLYALMCSQLFITSMQGFSIASAGTLVGLIFWMIRFLKKVRNKKLQSWEV